MQAVLLPLKKFFDIIRSMKSLLTLIVAVLCLCRVHASTIQFTAATASVAEKRPAAKLVVARDDASGTETVEFKTTGAGAGTHFVATNTTLTFASGVRQLTVLVPIIPNDLDEANVTFTAALENPGAGATLGSTAQTTVTILDDDKAGVVNVGKSAFKVREGAGNVAVTISRSGGTAGGVSVNYTTAAGTADNADFTPVSGTVTFAARERSKSFVVPITFDSAAEAMENFRIILSNPTGGATLGRAEAFINIINQSQPTTAFMTANAGGQAFNANLVQALFFPGLNNTLSVSGYVISASNGREINLSISGMTGPGTYSLGYADMGLSTATYSVSSGIVSEPVRYKTFGGGALGGPSGTVTITEYVAGQYVTGTFSFVGEETTDGDPQVTISNGQFRANF